jgi:hypothetical protein
VATAKRYQTGLVVLFFFTWGSVFLARMSVLYLAPFFAPELHLSHEQVGLLASALAMAWAASGLVLGAGGLGAWVDFSVNFRSRWAKADAHYCGASFGDRATDVSDAVFDCASVVDGGCGILGEWRAGNRGVDAGACTDRECAGKSCGDGHRNGDAGGRSCGRRDSTGDGGSGRESLWIGGAALDCECRNDPCVAGVRVYEGDGAIESGTRKDGMK